MEKLMTIQLFSKQTGIPKSALRYYESINLIQSERDQSSGYRLYSQDQIAVAKMIASLRVAGIPVNDIQQYLQSEDTTKKKLKEQWIQTIKEKQQQLDISLRYLESSPSDEIYLMEKEAETIIWFPAEAAPGRFYESFMKRRMELKKLDVVIQNGYLKYRSGNRKVIQADIGFGVGEKVAIPGGNIEKVKPLLCIGLNYHGDFKNVKAGYRILFHYAIENDWAPSGAVMEWYRGDQLDDMDIILPVIDMGGDEG